MTQGGIYRLIDGIYEVVDRQVETLVTLAIFESEIIFSKIRDSISSVIIWQLCLSKRQGVILQFVGHEQHMGSSDSLCIAIFGKDGIYERCRGSVHYPIVDIFSTLAENLLHFLAYGG